MQKKLLLLTASLISVGALFSCGQKKAAKSDLTFGKLYDANASIDDNFEVIDVSDIRSMIEKESNFALVVYDTNSTCTCWVTFQETIRKYMKYSNCMFYAVDFDELNSSGDTFGIKLSKGNESVVIFKDGKIIAQRNTADSNDKFTYDFQVFDDWMDTYVNLSDMLYVTESQMYSLFDGDDCFTLGFLRRTCSDCAYLTTHLLKEYNAKNNNLSYVIECDVKGIRLGDDGKVDSEQWQAFKDKMGLSEASNSEYGYGQGYVPTFVRYNPDSGKIKDYASCVFDASVYLNDVITKEGENYVISDSFYNTDRISNVAYLEQANIDKKVLVGTEVNKDDLIITKNAVFWKTEAAAKYHDPLFKSFLDFYIGM